MQLSTTEANPEPPGANVLEIVTRDKVTLRAAYWNCGDVCSGTVAILPGHAEFIEKYFEVIGELLSRGFDVAILDWRSQGRSQRLARNPHKGHTGNFRAYERDLDAFAEQILAPFCRPPWYALCHSMGGAIALAKARTGHSPFSRLVLTSPMIDLYGLRFRRSIEALARALVWFGQGRRFVPRGARDSHALDRFEANIVTSDPVRHARTAEIVKAAPYLAIGDPTIGWLNAAFRLMRRFREPEFPRRLLTPVLIVAAGSDHLVDSAATEEFAQLLKAGKCITIPGAKHEILMEREPFRELFWAAFDAFLPGEGSAHDQFRGEEDTASIAGAGQRQLGRGGR